MGPGSGADLGVMEQLRACIRLSAHSWAAGQGCVFDKFPVSAVPEIWETRMPWDAQNEVLAL